MYKSSIPLVSDSNTEAIKISLVSLNKALRLFSSSPTIVIHQDLDLDVSLMFSLKVVTLTLMPSGLFRRLVRGMSEWLVRHRYFWKGFS